VKQFVLFDHDGVLVDTEPWYFEAGRRALAEIGFGADLDDYLADMAEGRGTWARARAAGATEEAIDRARSARDSYYQEYLRTEDLEIEGVLDVLTELSSQVRMAIVTTSKRVDFELIHRKRQILPFMEFALVREDYVRAKPHPEPYLTALERFGASADAALVVEDSARGVASAVAAGIDCCVVHHDFTATQDLSSADYRIDTIGDLPALLVRLK
jgi:HAD superfamily hydrolase (TIGR01509 family)